MTISKAAAATIVYPAAMASINYMDKKEMISSMAVTAMTASSATKATMNY